MRRLEFGKQINWRKNLYFLKFKFGLGRKEIGLMMIFGILILNGSVKLFRNAWKWLNKKKLWSLYLHKVEIDEFLYDEDFELHDDNKKEAAGVA